MSNSKFLSDGLLPNNPLNPTNGQPIQALNPAQGIVFGANVVDADPATYIVAPSYELGSTLGKAEALKLWYTPGAVVESLQPATATGARIVTSTALVEDDGVSYIRVSNRSGSTDRTGVEYFEGSVAVGAEFLASLANAGAGSAFGTATYIHIFDDAGATHLGANLIQSLQYNTSGQQPMYFGDQVGGVTLVGYNGLDNDWGI